MIPVGDLFLDVLYDTSDGERNDASMVFRLQYGEISFLFTGDVGASTETTLRQAAPERLASTVLKVANHGISNASSLAFLKVVKSQIAVYSAGVGNTDSQPHASTLDHLKAVGATVGRWHSPRLAVSAIQ